MDSRLRGNDGDGFGGARWLALIAGLLASLGAAADSTRTPRPAIVIAEPATQCIAPNDVMRRTHMDLLRHQRDRTLRQGIRGEKASLNACVECHAGKASGSVLGADGFCQSCHGYAAVKIDCFECHSAKAKQPAVAAREVRQ